MEPSQTHRMKCEGHAHNLPCCCHESILLCVNCDFAKKEHPGILGENINEHNYTKHSSLMRSAHQETCPAHLTLSCGSVPGRTSHAYITAKSKTVALTQLVLSHKEKVMFFTIVPNTTVSSQAM